MGYSAVGSQMLCSRAMETLAEREGFAPLGHFPPKRFANRCTENQFLSTIRNNERASYNGSTGASQASSSKP
jgi:hypothetical protein